MAEQTTSAELDEYQLGYSGEELDDVCKKVLAIGSSSEINKAVSIAGKITFGSVAIKPQTTSIAGTSVSLDGYENPVALAFVLGSGVTVEAQVRKSVLSLSLSGSLSTSQTYTVNYIVGEGS